MKVKRIDFKLSSPITEADRVYNREQLSYLVQGITVVDAGRIGIPKHYTPQIHSDIASAASDDSLRDIELFANGATNIYFGKREDGGPTGFVQVRPSVLFIVHPDECFERYFKPPVREAWHRAVYSHEYDEVVILTWGNSDNSDDNDIIVELDKVEAVYGRKVIQWRPLDIPPVYCRDRMDKWRNWVVEVGGCFRNECVAEWTLLLEKYGVKYQVLDELTVGGEYE